MKSEARIATTAGRIVSVDPGPAQPDLHAPARYNRRILLMVTGLSPQVVTETLYGLAHQEPQPFVPTEIHVVTTVAGAQRVKLLLLDKQQGAYHAFCRDYGIEADGIRFDESNIHLLCDKAGAPLADIDSEASNREAANTITHLVSNLTADADCAVHASIAGGRKTMGFYLGYALSLHGRPQDRLSHVLVSAPFESEQAFYYPPPAPRVMVIKGLPVHTSDAQVTLANIPFVRLRDHLAAGEEAVARGFDEVVTDVQRHIAPPSLALDLAASAVEADGRTVALAPTRLALLAVFARRAIAGEPSIAAPAKYVPDRQWGERYLAEYRAIQGPMGATDATERALYAGMSGEYFSSQLSNLRRALRCALGARARPFLIEDGGLRPRRYHLALRPQDITFVEGGQQAGSQRRP
ncbi:MAG: TIGR02584 family CRISPR-associated protein [Gammaproteobacteria bacterium]|nr:TIGR02584 family CRISPR-associated protein [Gammaproteobacteria bacterium]